ncbi:MAG: hypothetical protein K6G34_15070 [Lachnospiraceae bacterium]|nr:hypothetical protein [Lachnospiraceae bacterium]
MSLKLMNDEEDTVNYLYSEDGWENISGEELSDKLDEVDEEYIIEAGSGERLELKDPEW